MIIHVFADTPHHFLPMSRFFLSHCKTQQAQCFIVKSSDTELDSHFECYTNVEQLKALVSAKPAESVILFHGVFDVHVWKAFAFSPLLKRARCVFWGAELYRHKKPVTNFKERLARLLHKIFIKRQQQVYALNAGDALMASAIFGRDVAVMPYPLIGVKAPTSRPKPSPIKILIGNSAAPSNNHAEIIEALSRWKNEDIEVIAPLNYGGEAGYVEQVCKIGQERLGDKFKPITAMLAKEQYDTLLSDVHCTVFAQERQQGLYVAYAMLLMGKPMYLLSHTTSYTNLTGLGFEIKKTDDLAQTSFVDFASACQAYNDKNASLMQQHFTEEALAPKWLQVMSKDSK